MYIILLSRHPEEVKQTNLQDFTSNFNGNLEFLLFLNLK